MSENKQKKCLGKKRNKRINQGVGNVIEDEDKQENLLNKSIDNTGEIMIEEEEKEGQFNAISDKSFTKKKEREIDREEMGLDLEEERIPIVKSDPYDEFNAIRNQAQSENPKIRQYFFTDENLALNQKFYSSLNRKSRKNINPPIQITNNIIIGNENNINQVLSKPITKNKRLSAKKIDNSTQSDLPAESQETLKIEQEKENRNYQKDKALTFLVQLAIVFEGSDYCSAAGWEYGTDTIFLCYNNFGRYQRDKNKEKNEEQNQQEFEEGNTYQTDMIHKVIDDLLEKRIELTNFDSCKNLLEILLANICYCLKNTNSEVYEKDDQVMKNKILRYLHIFFGLRRPTRNLRRFLGIPHVFAYPRIQNKIKRFVWAIKNLMKSYIYKNYISERKCKIKIKHECLTKVHAEMKILDIFIQRHILHMNKNKQVTDPHFLKDFPVDKSAPKKIYVAPSRLPCERCYDILRAINTKFKNQMKFIFPIKIDYSRKLFQFDAPDFLNDTFLKDENFKNDYKDYFLNIAGAIKSTENVKTGHEKHGKVRELTDAYTSYNEKSQYTFKDKHISYFSISSPDKVESLENFIIENASNSLRCTQKLDRWTDKERREIHNANIILEKEVKKFKDSDPKKI